MCKTTNSSIFAVLLSLGAYKMFFGNRPEVTALQVNKTASNKADSDVGSYVEVITTEATVDAGDGARAVDATAPYDDDLKDDPLFSSGRPPADSIDIDAEVQEAASTKADTDVGSYVEVSALEATVDTGDGARAVDTLARDVLPLDLPAFRLTCKAARTEDLCEVVDIKNRLCPATCRMREEKERKKREKKEQKDQEAREEVARAKLKKLLGEVVARKADQKAKREEIRQWKAAEEAALEKANELQSQEVLEQEKLRQLQNQQAAAATAVAAAAAAKADYDKQFTALQVAKNDADITRLDAAKKSQGSWMKKGKQWKASLNRLRTGSTKSKKKGKTSGQIKPSKKDNRTRAP